MNLMSSIAVTLFGSAIATVRVRPSRLRGRTVCLMATSGGSSLMILASTSKRDRSTAGMRRSEEHTSELQSQSNLVCRLLLEKKKTITKNTCFDILVLKADIRYYTSPSATISAVNFYIYRNHILSDVESTIWYHTTYVIQPSH